MGLPECLAQGKDGKDALEARLYMTADKDDYCLLDMTYLPNKGILYLIVFYSGSYVSMLNQACVELILKLENIFLKW